MGESGAEMAMGSGLVAFAGRGCGVVRRGVAGAALRWHRLRVRLADWIQPW